MSPIRRCQLLLSCSILACAPLSAAVVDLEAWTFENDSDTDGLRDAENSGTMGSSWNFNTTSQGDLANGSGQFVLAGDSGTTTRKLPRAGFANAQPTADIYASPMTTGKYVLGVDFASWDSDTASFGDSWKLGVNDSTGSNTIAQMIWDVDSASSVRLRFATTTDGGSRFRNITGFGLTATSAPMVELEFDFDNDTVRYLVDGVETHSFDDFNGADIGQLIYVKSGSWATAATTVSIESMGLRQIPEPSSGLLGGIGVLALLGRRRR